MMSKALSTREKILLSILIVLLIALLYYTAVYTPTNEIIAAAREEINGLSGLLAEEQEKAEQIQKMRKALEELDVSAETTAVTPLYDNFKNLIEELNQALSAADSYKLNFIDPVTKDGIAKRELQLVFYSSNYYSARKILDNLYSGPYRCDITSFKLAAKDSSAGNLVYTPVTATVSILYYEINK